MPTLSIRGIDVEFPYDPYDCQRVYMEKVIAALQEGKNALLESPTGTGKTLCLLCASLAWLKVARLEQIQSRMHAQDQAQDAFAPSLSKLLGGESSGSNQTSPRIYYASRTHSQLAQAVRELRTTSYTPSVTVLGSRDQLCIHEEVSKAQSNASKTILCQQKTSQRTCRYYNEVEQMGKSRNKAVLQEIASMDIEDLIKFGKDNSVCPFFLSKKNFAEADIVFVPYNYLLQSQTRAQQQILLKNNLVIFDEAHNIEGASEESVSFDLTSLEVARCLQEANRAVEMLESGILTLKALTTELLAKIKVMLLSLENSYDALAVPPEGLTYEGTHFYPFLEQIGVNEANWKAWAEDIQTVITFLLMENSTQRLALAHFLEVLRNLFSEQVIRNRENLREFYRVHIHDEEETKAPATKAASTWAKTAVKRKARYMSFWCFSPAFALHNILSEGVRSVILTSGTMSPLRAFSAALMADFPITLENPHVIQRKQVFVCVVKRGPNGVELRSTYENRKSDEYMQDLGNSIVNFARCVPNGLLVFFPSYSVMKGCIEHWQAGSGDGKSIWERISQYKAPVIEPQDKHEFLAAIDQFYRKVKDKSIKGAVFFAVCRGKVSEGLDFADDNGRAVVITGLPFPHLKDSRVVLKRQFLDGRVRAGGMSGNDWYTTQASRAVNQAIGRVIRHRHDYGAIIFCDSRFASKQCIDQLPFWVRPYVQVTDDFGQVQGPLTKFFKVAEADPDLRPQVKAQARVSAHDFGDEWASTDNPTGAGASSSSSSTSFMPDLPGKDGVMSIKRAPSGFSSTSSSMSSSTTTTTTTAFGAAPRPRMEIEYEVEGSAGPATAPVPALPPLTKHLTKERSGNLLSALVQHKALNVQVDAVYRGKDIHTPTPTDGAAHSNTSGGGSSLYKPSSTATSMANPFYKSDKESSKDTGSGTSAKSKPVVITSGKSLYKPKPMAEEPETATADASAPPAAAATAVSGDEGIGKRVSDYMERVTHALDEADRLQFNKLLKEFKGKRADAGKEAMRTLILGLWALFRGSNNTLFKDFRSMLSRSNQRDFDETLVEIVKAKRAEKDKARAAGATSAATATTAPAAEKRAATGGLESDHAEAEAERAEEATKKAKMDDAGHQGAAVSGGRRCALCGRGLENAFQAPCGHVSCYLCWFTPLKQAKMCPVSGCTAEFGLHQLKKLYLYS